MRYYLQVEGEESEGQNKMKMKALLKATIKSGNPEDNGKRIEIVCLHDVEKDGAFRWYQRDEDGTLSDTEVSEDSLQAAKDLAERAWAGVDWDLQASWL